MENSWVQEKGEIKVSSAPQIRSKIFELEGDPNLQI